MSIQWITEDFGLKSLRQLDGALAQTFFDSPNAYLLDNSAPPTNGAPVGWATVPSYHYTAFGPCGGDARCRSFQSDVSAGVINASEIPVVMYDSEAWPRTPPAERKDPCREMAGFTGLARSKRFLSIVAPDQNLMQPGGMIQSQYPGNETENWQSYIRYSMAACVARSGADRYHIMSQPFESRWCCNPAGNAQGSESDFINFVQQAALQARAVNPKVLITMGISTNPKYRPTPLTLYQDSIDVRDIVDGIWMNTGPRFRAATAVQYYELASGLAPLYLGSEGGLSSAYPTGTTRRFSLGSAGARLLSVSGEQFAAGTVIPAGSYKFQPFTDGRTGSATVALDFGFCETGNCSQRTPIIERDAWSITIPAGDPGVTATFTTSSATTLPAGGPYSLYLELKVVAPGNFHLNYDSGPSAANLAIPRPSTLPTPKPNTSLFFPDRRGEMGTRLPAEPHAAAFHLGTAGASRTFVSGRTYPAGTVIPADAYQFQYWTSGTSGSAVLSLEFGYCLARRCTERKPIIASDQNWTAALVAGAKGAASPYGAFTTREPATLPPGGPYRFYWTVTVKTPALVDLLYGAASAPTNLATPFVQPR